MQIIYCDSCNWLKDRLTNISPIFIKKTIFPSGEISVSLPKSITNSEEILLITDLTNSIHENLIEIFHIIDALKSIKFSGKINLLLPYFAYSRQDNDHCTGKSVGLRVISKLLYSIPNLQKVFSIDIHNHYVAKKYLPKLVNYNSQIFVAKYIQNLKLDNILIVAPDNGRKNFAQDLAKLLKCDYVTLDKNRTETGLKISISSQSSQIIKQKNVFLIDDIIDSGKTMLAATRLVHSYNTKSINVIASFMLGGLGYKLLNDSKLVDNFAVIFCNNTKNKKIDYIDALPHIIKTICNPE